MIPEPDSSVCYKAADAAKNEVGSSGAREITWPRSAFPLRETMRSTMRQSAALLALLAVLAHVVCCAVGGRVCVRLSSLPQTTGCESGCCDRAEGPERSVGITMMSDSPFSPLSPDCCIEVDDCAMLPSLDRTSIQESHVVLVPPILSGAGPWVCSAPPRASVASREVAQPPPSVAAIRTTVLLI